MFCEKKMTIVEAKNALLIQQSTKQVTPPKTHNNTKKTNKLCTNCGMTNHNVEACKKKKEHTIVAVIENNPTQSKIVEDIFVCLSHMWFEWT